MSRKTSSGLSSSHKLGWWFKYLLAISGRIFPEVLVLPLCLLALELSLPVFVVDEFVVEGGRRPQVRVLVVARVAAFERLHRSEGGVEGLVISVGIWKRFLRPIV